MSVVLDPTPGFVVKTRILEARSAMHTLSTKVFINICHDSAAPRPPTDFDPAVVFPLIIKNEWEIPLVVSNEKQNVDKKGVAAFVYDCCVNLVCFQWCQVNADLRAILIEWCIESVELLYEVVLEREYLIPKMLAKGELSQTEVKNDDLQKRLQELKNNETLGVLEELRPEDDDNDASLADLRNIHNRPVSRPIIEEISEMSILDRPKSTTPRDKLPQKTAPPIRELSVSFQPSSTPYSLAIRAQVGGREIGHVTVKYAPLAHYVAISVDSEAPTKVPLPSGMVPGPIRAVLVRRELVIWIFV